ncbi:thiol:disulfide interchange protein DsbG [Xanthomonas sacchari]|uniref:thiol:disulfide interchange protein DsbG n=1 Tax=Xanthomonas sacchari TaxID=56458 RepID=UPI0027D7EDC9|nr:thiol:disulfide interchange protein DsbG [Xanthomonas sacchari]
MSVVAGVAMLVLAAVATAAAPTPAQTPTIAERHLMASGVKVTHRFDSVSGLRAIVADNGSDKRLFYVTPDGKSLIAGLVFDDTGRNVTTDDMSRAGITGDGNTTTVTQLQAQRVWQRIQGLKALKDGSAGADIYVFVDPTCQYCHRLMGMVRPYIAAGKLQVRWLPVAILSSRSPGLAEAMYKTSSVAQAIQSVSTNMLKPMPETEAVRLQLAQNLLAMRDTGQTGVPLIVYRVGQRVVIKSGVPTDAELAALAGGAK